MQSDKLLLCTLESKILCKMYGPVQEKGELGTISWSPDIVRMRRVARL